MSQSSSSTPSMPSISDEALARLDALHAVIRDNSRTDYHAAMEKFNVAVAVSWESISARCRSTPNSETKAITNQREELELIRSVLYGFPACLARNDALRAVHALLDASSPSSATTTAGSDFYCKGHTRCQVQCGLCHSTDPSRLGSPSSDRPSAEAVAAANKWLLPLERDFEQRGRGPLVGREFCILAREILRLSQSSASEAPKVYFSSAVSGLWYEKPGAAGDIDRVSVAGRVFVPADSRVKDV